ncbi:ATP-binding cassette domain-containing protein [Brucella abortus]|uniref:ABC transporter ATP-binding protein n=1 Tax=Brucella abortus TaxID=235 RepID=UPI0012DABD97|nr:ABC transporter ATP-binding protein [Brucella abortus]MBI1645289.1 ABC transporter ATP-binding protein [Brucella abortus]MBI1672616.1 ABC transporter ATP-binding protein [Brucella abortus]MBJ8136845.1 ABC transporter ATP-binding protein [Brucella abortus]MUJ18385.1 ATP-binding cassette domain-containing protein [Brucella abortus]MUJ35760.1 ATP-binding cassette domain-containing protein [Brucella abortus]
MSNLNKSASLLRIENLRVGFGRDGMVLDAVRGLNLELERGEVLGIVGESGSGKSIGMLAAIGLAPPNAKVTGSVTFQGQELLGRSRREMRELRGSRIAMIFQDPLSSLNPVMKIGDQIIEALQLHQKGLSRKQALARAVELLELVSIPQPDQRVKQYPHEFSGGMRQRVMIAMAVANDPDLLIADEPTTALDVTVQAQIMAVLRDLQDKLGLGLILITHDLGVLAGHADRVAVVYAGEVVEKAGIYELFENPRHPYTRGLIASIPTLGDSGGKLFSIEGAPPVPGAFPQGCAFHPRCVHAQAICREKAPAYRRFGEHISACHFAESLPPFKRDTNEELMKGCTHA